MDSAAHARVTKRLNLVVKIEPISPKIGKLEMVARTISRPEHTRDVLRVAALIACVSGGVSSEEQNCLARMARRFALSDDAVEAAVAEARSVLRS
jgi:tellurite resistance protein